MESLAAALTRLVESQSDPFTLASVLLNLFLWRELQKEREARVAMLQRAIEVFHSIETAVTRLTDAIRTGKQ
jgi:hypothetical protein